MKNLEKNMIKEIDRTMDNKTELIEDKIHKDLEVIRKDFEDQME